MSTIYKYLPPERVAFLSNRLLRGTQPENLNDPFECVSIPPSKDEATLLCKSSHSDYVFSEYIDKRHNKKILKKMLNDEIQKIHKGISPNYLDHLISSQRGRINSLFGIISFSERWNSSIMWSHYSKSHEGFCVGFNKKNDFFYTDGDSFLTGKKVTANVEYSKKRIKIPITVDSTEFFTNSWRLLGLKSIDWSYEKEIRTIILLSEYDKLIKATSSLKNIYLFKMPKEAITEIIIGLRTKKILRTKIIKYAKLNKIKVYETVLSQDSFNLDRKEI